MPRPAPQHPTDRELEILKILWQQQPCELGKITAAIREYRDVATTTIATTLKVMMDKKLVRRRKTDRGYVWSAIQKEEDTTGNMLQKLLDMAFDGSTERLVSQLFDGGHVGTEEMQQIEALLRSYRAARSKDDPQERREKS